MEKRSPKAERRVTLRAETKVTRLLWGEVSCEAAGMMFYRHEHEGSPDHSHERCFRRTFETQWRAFSGGRTMAFDPPCSFIAAERSAIKLYWVEGMPKSPTSQGYSLQSRI
jgi:hypothetical protein